MNTKLYFFICFIILFLSNKNINSQELNDRTITVNIRGVEETKLTLTPFEGARAINPIVTIDKVKKGESAKLVIPAKFLPGEFVLRADYVGKPGDSPYPSEKTLLVYNQDIEIFMHPMYMNNSDSTTFAFGEQENTINNYFINENSVKRSPVELLKNFLLNYDNTKSSLFKKGTKEFEKRRKEYNKWLAEQTETYKDFFVSRLFQFQYMPPVKWDGNQEERVLALLNNYFDGINFKDSLIIRTPESDRFLNAYMGMYGAMSTSIELRDSLFTRAGRIASEKASKGHPHVYGWVVDYFNSGYQMYDIKPGIEMIKKHIDDTNCLTANKREIIRRLQELSKMNAGFTAPDFTLKDDNGKDFIFYSYNAKKYKLLFIWSADCEHCFIKKNKLKKWYSNDENKAILDIIAVSLDETETEIPRWEEAKKDLPGWIHLRAVGGVNSEFAHKYSLLATPMILLVDTKTNFVKAVIEEIEELDSFVKE